ncbi:ABC transporter permease [Agromyces sp. Root81]|uniref:carbohydrate ABC transporter permease n=1 Tax=Agromyces sp. Root81 TaxID=1736601 RepID=UPI0006F2F6FC|nr:carbohydrate ABC transporter permease [Agromyces sp. Root81]KRC61806.1 ABC transporter permease [Agromyces sp. Root81]
MKASLGRRVATYALAALIVVSTTLPLAWMLISGFKGRSEVLRTPFQFFPDVWLWQNYAAILQDPAFLQSMALTFAGALLFTLLSLVVNSIAAYAFARLDFRGKRFWWVYCITPMFIPGMAILLTSYVVVSNLGMLNTLAVLIIPGAASAVQMFFIRQFYLNTPLAIEEAALIDGAGRWRIFWSIFLPQSQGVFVVVGVGSFLAYWNAYVWPILTIQDPGLQQIMQYIAGFRSERGNEWGLLMAGSTLAALPTILLVLIFQRYIVNGVRLAGMK